MVGLTHPKTMRLGGRINQNEVTVMIDPGATHNFISLRVVEKLGIAVRGKEQFGVALGNGEAVQGAGVCKSVTLELEGGIEVCEDFLPLQLGGTDVILGVQWLEKLGAVITNWKTQVMKFQWGVTSV